MGCHDTGGVSPHQSTPGSPIPSQQTIVTGETCDNITGSDVFSNYLKVLINHVPLFEWVGYFMQGLVSEMFATVWLMIMSRST